MDNRFTFKDFVFTLLLLALIACTLLGIWQFNYQEKRVTSLQDEVKKLGDVGRQQLAVLENIQRTLKDAPRVAVQSATTPQADVTQAAADGIVRRKTPDGGLYVYAAVPPRTPRDPHDLPDYAQGDWRVQNLGSEPAVITPFIYRDASGASAQGPVLESLLTSDPETGENLPLLAESYECLPDGVTFRFVLRKGVTFSDGVPMTMTDVLFSYHTLMNPKVEAGPIQSYFSGVEYVKSLDERTLEIKFKEPYFLALENAGGVSIIPEHIYKFNNPEEYNKRTDTLVGTGPYMLEPKNWIKGQQITLTRNDKYWGERPTFDRIVMRFIPNPQAGLQALQNGQIDYMGAQPDQFIKYSKDSEFTARFNVMKFQNPRSGYMYMGYNQKSPIFQDKLTRQALTMLIDRDGLNNSIGMGLWYTVAGPFSSLGNQADPAIKPMPYDVDAAKKKLTEAGWRANSSGILERDGKPFRFAIMIPAQISVYEQISAYIKEQFRKVGIDVTINPLEFSVMVERLDQRDFDACVLRWTGGGSEEDPYQIWHSKSIEGRGSNFISYRNPVTDKLIEDARREMNPDKRLKLWREFFDIIVDEQPYTFLSASYSTVFMDKRFKNAIPYKLTGLNADDWYVPAAQQKYR